MARTRFRFTLKEDDKPESPELFSDVVWGEEQIHTSAPGGIVLVMDTHENPAITELYAKHGTLVASWQPI